MAVSGPSWSLGLAQYKRTTRTRVPSSIQQMVNSEKIICELLKEIYGHTYQDITRVDVCHSSSDIQGHLSDSGRLEVRVETVGGGKHHYHWFVKIMPLQHQNSDLVAKFDVFRNEIAFYSKIAPALRSFLKESGVQDEIEFDVPELLYSEEDGARAIIVLPDLIYEGYKQERDGAGRRYLSAEKAMIAVQSLARIQAAATALQRKKNIDIETVHPSLAESGAFWADSDMTSRLFMMKDVFCDFLNDSDELNADSLLHRFNKKFNSEEELQKLCQQRYTLSDDSLKCLLHGDFHFNNLLYKEEEGRCKVMIVDWQLTYCGRSAGDVSYLLLSSMDPQLREEHEDTIKKKYFNTFQDTLAMLSAGCKTVETVLEEDYQKSLPLGFFFSCGNVMQEDSSSKQSKTKFAFQLCREAAGRNLI